MITATLLRHPQKMNRQLRAIPEAVPLDRSVSLSHHQSDHSSRPTSAASAVRRCFTRYRQ